VPPAAKNKTSGQVVAYDFRRPNKFNRDHARVLQLVGETFSRQFTSILATTVRATSHLTFEGVGQLSYDEYVRDIPSPTYLAMLTMAPLPGVSLLHIPLPVLMAAFDRMLGGSGNGLMPSRPLSDIETGLAHTFVNRILRELADAFTSLVAVTIELAHQESNPQFTQIAAPSETMVVLSFDLRIAGHSGAVTLCIPFAQIQSTLDDATGSIARAGRVEVDTDALRQALTSGMEQAPIQVTVRFNEIALRASDILDLRPGDIVPLAHGIDTPLCLTVGGIPRFEARPGRRGRRMAAMIVDICEASNRDISA